MTGSPDANSPRELLDDSSGQAVANSKSNGNGNNAGAFSGSSDVRQRHTRRQGGRITDPVSVTGATTETCDASLGHMHAQVSLNAAEQGSTHGDSFRRSCSSPPHRSEDKDGVTEAGILHAVASADPPVAEHGGYVPAEHVSTSAFERRASADVSESVHHSVNSNDDGIRDQAICSTRRRARKSTRPLPQAAVSVQQSNAAAPESITDVPDVKPFALLDEDGARDSSSTKLAVRSEHDDEVIDLT